VVASAGQDNTVRLWPAIADPQTLCKKLTTNMSEKQWRDWVLPDIPYISGCSGFPSHRTDELRYGGHHLEEWVKILAGPYLGAARTNYCLS